MIVNAVDMARAVRVAIDMNKTDDPLILEEDSDTLTLDEIIYAKLAEAVRLVEMEAPLIMLESGHDLMGGAEAYPLDKKSGHDLMGGAEAYPLDKKSGQGIYWGAEACALDKKSGQGIYWGAEACALDKKTGQGIYWGEGGKGFIILPDDFMRLISFRMSDWERTVHEAISESDPQYALQSSRFKGICGNPEKPVVAIVRRSEGKVLEFYSCKTDEASVSQATYLPIPKIDRDGGIDVAEDCYRAAVYRAASLALASVGDQLSTTMLEISKSLLQ